MHSIRRLAFLLALMVAGLAVHAGFAQNASEASSIHNLEPFEPVDFPDPSRYRTADGRPGPSYWQNEADYQIDVRLDTVRNRLSGTQTITYTNNSPQALDRLWVQLEQNYFRPDSRGAKANPGERFSGFFEGAGYTLSSVRIRRNGEAVAPDTLVDGTRMKVALREPLAANGGTLQLELKWSFQIPKDGADRHGITDVQQGTIYQLAQWYPRMYVYDDVHGWNPMPFLGQGEFYLEYGTFNVNITVPRNMIVAATGRLQNPGKVLTETQRERLQKARKSRETVMIVDSTEVGDPSTRPDGSGPLTWRYKAENVRDFAWAASSAFIWDAARAEAGGETVLAQSYYPREGLGTEQKPGWENSTEFVQHSVEFYSDFVAPYPYPNAINVAGGVLGMEYPQIVFCDMTRRGQSLFGVTDHELGHTWFPMVVGSDERRWAWMDEGLNQFMNQYSELDYYGEGTPTGALSGLSGITVRGMGKPDAQPIMTYADRVSSYGRTAYLKPANGLMLLREHVLGPRRFDAALKAYFDRWAYKHPKPADFFRTIEDVTGEDLDWFWRSWFYETDVADPAVASVDTASTARDTAAVTIEQNGELMLPVPVRLTFEDGTTQRRHVPEEAFYTQDASTLRVTEGPLRRVTVDPSGILPDTSRANNAWNRTGEGEVAGLSAADGTELEPVRLSYEGTPAVSRTLRPTSTDGNDTWTIITEGAGGGPDSLIVDRETLRPKSQVINSEADVRLMYTDSLVTGTARTSGRSIPIRASIDDPVLFEGYSFHHPLTTLGAMPLRPGFVASFDVFELPRSVKTMRYRVTGTETVETPAGRFETYVVNFRVRGGGASGTAYLRRKAPHHVIRLTADQGGGETFTQQLTSISGLSDRGG
ncbi:MAG: M1 family aminopeptidase [Salinibacter sp.]